MNWANVLMLFTVIWPLAFFIVLPVRIHSQSEKGEVVPGTPPGAPIDPGLRWKVVMASLVTLVLCILAVGIIYFDVVRIEDIGVFWR